MPEARSPRPGAEPRAPRGPPTPVDRWRRLGALLPRDVRERVFEPAIGDLARGWLTRGAKRGRLPFAAYAVGTYLGCFPAAARGLLVRRGRLTRLGRAAVWGVGLATALVLVVRLAGYYSSYDP